MKSARTRKASPAMSLALWSSFSFVLCGLYLTWPALRAQHQPGPAVAAVEIDADRVEGQISPVLYGQFDEFMFEGVKRGLTAELIRDRSFDEAPNAIGLPRYWEREPDDRNDDPGLHFHWDDAVYYSMRHEFMTERTEHSLRVDLAEDDGQRRGIRQGGISIRQGLPYHGYLWIRTDGFKARIHVALEVDRTGGETYSSAEINALRPAFIRWPGGNVAQDYHWMWGIGPRDQRLTWTNLSWGNEPEPSDFGTDEFVRLCRNVSAEPSITVNVEGRGATPTEAAAWVEYANGPASSRQGAMRATNGNSNAFKVKYWEVGNEIWGDWVRGHSDANTYAQNFERYAAAMSGVDPSIQLIAVGDNNMDWNRTVLRLAGPHIDYLAIHHYYSVRQMMGDPLNLMAHPLFYERFYKQVGGLIRDLVPGRTIKLAINEWNTSSPLPRQHSMESALYAARLMNVFERSDIVAMSAVSDMVNGWSGGMVQASRDNLFVTPTYLVNELYNRHLGAQRITARVSSPTFDTTREGKGVPYLDVVVSRTADGKHIFIIAVNTDPQRALCTSVHIVGAQVSSSAVIETINADSMTSANSFATPNAVSLQQKTIKVGPHFLVDFPQHSVSVITLNILSPTAFRRSTAVVNSD